jgi:ABC-type phosphate/phosphonate transport system substrate-binding protein
VEQVLEGKAEAAAVSYYVFEKDKHLNLEQREKLRVIQRQGPVASHTFCARNSLPENERNLIQKALLEIVVEEPELCQSLFGGTLISVDPEMHLMAPRQAKLKVSTLKD